MEREALKLALDDIVKIPTLTAGLLVKLIDVEAIINEALAQPEPDMLTIAYQSGYHDGKQAALAGREWNFCERCGKRTADKTVIHTCTPPQGNT